LASCRKRQQLATSLSCNINEFNLSCFEKRLKASDKRILSRRRNKPSYRQELPSLERSVPQRLQDELLKTCRLHSELDRRPLIVAGVPWLWTLPATVRLRRLTIH
jgi:hypothetical protein